MTAAFLASTGLTDGQWDLVLVVIAVLAVGGLLVLAVSETITGGRP